MFSDRFHTLSVFGQKRLAIAQHIVERKQQELGITYVQRLAMALSRIMRQASTPMWKLSY